MVFPKWLGTCGFEVAYFLAVSAYGDELCHAFVVGIMREVRVFALIKDLALISVAVFRDVFHVQYRRHSVWMFVVPWLRCSAYIVNDTCVPCVFRYHVVSLSRRRGWYIPILVP